MDEEEKQAIRNCATKLIDSLAPTKVVAFLHQKRVLTQLDLDDISSCQTRAEKVLKIITVLPMKGPSAFSTFCEALRLTGQGFMAADLDDQHASHPSYGASRQDRLLEQIKRDQANSTAMLQIYEWMPEHMRKMELFTRLKILSRKKEKSRLTDSDVDLHDIFKCHEECPNQPRVVLIEGAPGYGKTTACQKLVYDWSTSKITAETFPKVKLVIPLKCRDFESSDIFQVIKDQLCLQSEDEIETIKSMILKEHRQVLVILDGLDEVKEEFKEMVEQVVKGELLKYCYVVLSTRPEPPIEVRQYCDSLFQIDGFTSDDVHEYVRKYYSGDKEKTRKMTETISSDHNLQSLAGSPLNTAILCAFLDDTDNLPATQTDLYQLMVSCILRRYLKKRKQQDVVISSELLMEQYEDILIALGGVALRSLRKDQLHFDYSEIAKDISWCTDLGFLVKEKSRSIVNPRLSFTFCHKTFQEFLAAFYLVKVKVKERNYLFRKRKKFFADLSDFAKHEQMQLFISGLLADDCQALSYFTEVAQALVSHNDYSEEISGILLCCLGEFIVRSSSVDNDAVSILAKHLPKETFITRYAVNERQVPGLCALLKNEHCTNIVNLSVKGTAMSNAAWHTIAGALGTYTNLHKLTIYGGDIRDSELIAVVNALERSNSLHELVLEHIAISDITVQAIVRWLKNSETLEELRFSGIRLSNVCLIDIANALTVNTHLNRLELSNLDLQFDSAATEVYHLVRSAKLEHLYLTMNNFGNKTACAIARALKENTSSMCSLSLDHNNIGDEGAMAICDALIECHERTHLDITRNPISDTCKGTIKEKVREQKIRIYKDWNKQD